jgi:DNA-directed RNA polymerase subunit beta'
VQDAREKKALLDGYERQAEKVETQFRRGIITDGERRQQEVRIWTDATDRGAGRDGEGFKAERSTRST